MNVEKIGQNSQTFRVHIEILLKKGGRVLIKCNSNIILDRKAVGEVADI